MNVTTVGPTPGAVTAALQNLERVTYVTPSAKRITVVFDRQSDADMDPVELGDLAYTLSRDLQCTALAAAVYDDDTLLLGLYEGGIQLGEYNSTDRSSLSASTLARVCGVPSRTIILWAAFRCPRFPLFVFESFRHYLILKVLRMPPWAYATGYRYIQQGEGPPTLQLSELSHLGYPPA